MYFWKCLTATELYSTLFQMIFVGVLGGRGAWTCTINLRTPSSDPYPAACFYYYCLSGIASGCSLSVFSTSFAYR